MTTIETECYVSAFNNTDEEYWSDTEQSDPEFSSYAWFLGGKKKNTISSHRVTYQLTASEICVRLMRSANCKDLWKKNDDPYLRFVISDCGGFVLDRKTALEWKRDPEPVRYRFHDAKEKFISYYSTLKFVSDFDEDDSLGLNRTENNIQPKEFLSFDEAKQWAISGNNRVFVRNPNGTGFIEKIKKN